MRAGRGTGDLLALGFCYWSCWCPSPSLGTEQGSGSWRGLDVPRQGAVGGSSSSFLVPPGVVCDGQERCLSLAEPFPPCCCNTDHSTGWSLGLGEQEAPVPCQPSRHAHTVMLAGRRGILALG